MKNDCSLIIKSLFKGNKVLYISLPITSGIKFLEWYSKEGYSLDFNSDEYLKQKEEHVLIPNYNNSRKIIKNIRKRTPYTVIDPLNLENTKLKWEQEHFYSFWNQIIIDCVDELLFIDGWEYSIGCCYEFVFAIEQGKTIMNQALVPFSLKEGIDKIRKSHEQYEKFNVPGVQTLGTILNKLEYRIGFNKTWGLDCIRTIKLKDEKLHELISRNLGNIAQYISIRPSSYEPYGTIKPTHVHIRGIDNLPSNNIEEIIKLLINSSASKAVNIRSFSPLEMKGNKLIYGKKIDEIDEIVSLIKKNVRNGRYSIINENIDIKDGGVSGVVLGNIIEFSPEDTPKCVDKEDVCSLPRNIGIRILNIVYGFMPELNYDPNYRIEFSIHPKRQGVLNGHTIIWEYEHYANYYDRHKIRWSNRFSRFLGDKVFGLLIADSLGLNVPKTTVISRYVAPFTFGKSTGIYEKWIRTCPADKEPGKFYTGYGWVDPYELMNSEEKKGELNTNIVSIISQFSVNALYSGAAFIRKFEKDDLIEGVFGVGDSFMIGKRESEDLPYEVLEEIKNTCNEIRKFNYLIGEVSIEWVYDGEEVWIVQINQLNIKTIGVEDEYKTIVKGNPLTFKKVYVKDGLDNLRNAIKQAKTNNLGINLIGNVGITSHFGDLLRLANIPSRLIDKEKISQLQRNLS